jgi:hypothetical protein
VSRHIRDRPSLLQSFSPLAPLPSRTPIPAAALARSAHTHLTVCPHLLSRPHRPSARKPSRAAKEGSCVTMRKLGQAQLAGCPTEDLPPIPHAHAPAAELFEALPRSWAPATPSERDATAKRKGEEKKTNGSNGGPFLAHTACCPGVLTTCPKCVPPALPLGHTTDPCLFRVFSCLLSQVYL